MNDDVAEELDYEELSPLKMTTSGRGAAAAAAAGGGQATATATTTAAPKKTDADATVEDADAIYGDLFAPAAPPAVGPSSDGGAAPALGSIAALEADELRRRAASQAAAIAALQAEVDALKAERTAWRAERATLLTNMSSLFLTAKAELARKDVAIKEARAGGR